MPTPAAAAADDAPGQVSAETEAKSAATSFKSEIEAGTGTATATANVKKKQQLQALTLPPPLPLSPLPLLWTPGWESLFTGTGAGTSSGSLFGLGHSPGPITLARSCFGSPGDVAAATTPGSDVEFKSFSQLLATAIASPSASASANTPASVSLSRGGAGFFPLSPGFSPGLLLDSPQASLGVSHQEALAQVQAQAQLRGRSCFESALPVSSSCQVEEYHAGAGGDQGNGKGEGTTHAAATVADENNEVVLASQPSTEITQKSLSTVTLAPADKPADDGYNWRKYGQKAVKGSEYPRSYYRCTYVSCPVKKKVERSLDGVVTEIVYKGEHNHSRPQHGKPLAASAQNTMFSEQDSPHEKDHSETREHANAIALDASMELDMSQGCSVDVDDEEDDEAARPDNDDDDNDAAVPKRRKKEKNIQDIVAAPRTIKEPRIIVQTTSDVDILDDGYRWRKYGQKVVKGNPNPRSYYKCTNAGCTVRKHVERASNDAKAVITTYEGKHNHDVPTCKNSNDSASLNSQFHHGTHAVTRITASKASVSLLDQQMAPSLIH